MEMLQVGRATKCVGADYALETVNNLAQAIPDIVMINGSEEDDQQAMGRSMSDLETFLTVGA